MGRPLLASGLYFVCMAGFVYGLGERQVGYGSDVAGALVLAALAVLQVVTGFGAARWWAILLPALAVLVAIPAGYPDANRGSDPLPIWIGLAFLAPVGALLVAAGVATVAMLSRRHGSGRTVAD